MKLLLDALKSIAAGALVALSGILVLALLTMFHDWVTRRFGHPGPPPTIVVCIIVLGIFWSLGEWWRKGDRR